MKEDLYYTMELQGDGSLMVEPDIAILRLGVETNNQDLKVAQQENALTMQNIILSLQKMGIAEEDIQTEAYNIYKKYDYVEGQQIDRGYVVSHILKITLKNIDQTGEVVDTAVNNGANVVQGITFDIEDPSFYYQEALNFALSNAMEKAEALGKELGVRVLRVPIRITEQSASPVPYNTTYLAKNGATPIEPGQKQIVARIQAIFSYYPG